MGVLRTVCGFYCAMTSLVGIYFFVVLAVMEFRGNAFLTQIVQNIVEEDNESKKLVKHNLDNNQKGIAFLITAGIQLVFTIACYFCGTQSLA